MKARKRFRVFIINSFAPSLYLLIIFYNSDNVKSFEQLVHRSPGKATCYCDIFVTAFNRSIIFV